MPTDLNNQLPQLQLLPANQPPHYICNYSLQDVSHKNIFKKIHSYSKILCLDRPRTSITTLHLRLDIRSQGLPFWPKSMLFLRLQSHMHNTTVGQKKNQQQPAAIWPRTTGITIFLHLKAEEELCTQSCTYRRRAKGLLWKVADLLTASHKMQQNTE